MNTSSEALRLPSGDDSVPPVTILDADGHVVGVVSAEEFRRMHPPVVAPRRFSRAESRHRRRVD